MKFPRTYYLDLSPEGLRNTFEQLSKILEGRLSFGRTNTNPPGGGTVWNDHRNVECWKANGTTPGVANTEFSVSHQLPYVPVTFTHHTDNGGVIYKSTTAWTAATTSSAGQIFLKCTTVSANYQLVVM